MEDLSALWRVRGSLPVPVESDDNGLVSRIADVFSRDVVEERDDYLLFSPPEYYVRLPVRGIEIRREGIRGWRQIRYDIPVLDAVPNILLHGTLFGGFLGQALVWAGLPPYAYLTPALAMVLLYLLHYRAQRSSAHAMLRRAFAV